MKNQTNENAKASTQLNTNNTAVVDVQVIVNSSAQVKALKEAQAAKINELNLWLQNAQKEVNAEQDKERQQALLQKWRYRVTVSARIEKSKRQYFSNSGGRSREKRLFYGYC